MIKHLYVGHLRPGQTSLMRLNALKRHSLDIVGLDLRSIWDKQNWLSRRIAWATERGDTIDAMNKAVLQSVQALQPRVVWFDKQEFVRPETLETIKETGALLVYYTPDPYFAVSWKQTGYTRACMPIFDIHITSKTYEVEKFRDFGGTVIYMPLGYCEEVHRPVDGVRSDEMFNIGFVGGWEPRRQVIVENLVDNGLSVRVWGYGWDHLIDGKWTIRRFFRLKRLSPEGGWPSIRRSEKLAKIIEPREIYDEAYSRALTRSTISLGLLRSIYPDQHTTRTFEIPACGSMLLADDTDEHREFFEDGKEAIFFETIEELIDKARFFAEHDSLRNDISVAGRERCIASGYSYFNRFIPVLKEIAKLV